MAEKAEASGGSHARLPTGSEPRSFSDARRHDLYPASIKPLRAPPSTLVARPPLLDLGQITRTASSGPTLGGSDRLRPLTPIHTKTNSSGAMFTTSPASSELGSPRLPNIRPSTSNTSLNNFNRGLRPPTPTAKRSRGVRPSSLPRRSPVHSRKSSSNPGTPHPHGKPSVKHLTCFWWKEKGDCRFKEEDCLYAHHDTGLYADPPRQVIPGGEFDVVQRHLAFSRSQPASQLTNAAEPAMAGRSLDRALKKLHSDQNKSSSSLKSMSSEVIHADPSRPGSPGSEPQASPAVVDQIKADNAFLRNLIEQNTKEKAVLINAIDSLQAESKTMKEENASLKVENDKLKQEHELLCATVNKPQINYRQPPTSNPFGPIGSNPGLPAFRRAPAPTPIHTNSGGEHAFVPSPTESENQSSQVESMLRHLGGSF